MKIQLLHLVVAKDPQISVQMCLAEQMALHVWDELSFDI